MSCILIVVAAVGSWLADGACLVLDVFWGIRNRHRRQVPSRPGGTPRTRPKRPGNCDLAGCVATVSVPLNPAGRVVLNGAEYAALSFRKGLAAGARVRIVRAGRFSLLVEPLADAPH